jgi:pyruvate formate lyase activating enzyme
MGKFDYLEADLSSCKLCEWRCGVDRLGEDLNLENNSNYLSKINSVCGCTIPLVASSQLHPAPPASFDAFMIGCNFRCLFCQNWPISMFDVNTNMQARDIEGYYDPSNWAELALASLTSNQAQYIKADRLFFTGGEPTCALPWVEEVVLAARQIIPDVKVNFDTNGFMTSQALKRILEFTTSITYDLKAYDPKLFSALTGANVKPVLRNLKYIIKHTPDKLWEVRVMVIQGIHDEDVPDMCKFLSDLDPAIKLNFLAFRPNFVMEEHYGTTNEFLEKMLTVAHDFGLINASWSGRAGSKGKLPQRINKNISEINQPHHLALPLAYAHSGGCSQESRNCGACSEKNECGLKRYRAKSFN